MTLPNEAVLKKIRGLRLVGMIDALIEQANSPSTYADLSFNDRLALLIDAEDCRRGNQRISRLIRQAKIPNNVSIADLDCAQQRGFTKKDILDLCSGNWVSSGKQVIVTGKTGVGKSFISGAIALELCKKGISTKSLRTHEWIVELSIARNKARLSQAIAGLRKTKLLIFDEWMRDVLTLDHSRLLLDLIDDRYNNYSMMFISQIAIKDWHKRFEDPTIADAVLDRIVHSAIRIELQGESMRKVRASVKSKTC